MYATVGSALYETMFSDEDGEIYSDLMKLDAPFDVRQTTNARLFYFIAHFTYHGFDQGFL